LSYENPWLYQGEVFDGEGIDKYHGFVYIITCPDGRKYIGRKTFWFMRKKPGAKRRSKLESDWKKYYGSNEEIKEYIKTNGTTNFKREILSLHVTKGEMNYTEIKEQFLRGVLETDDYMNDNINGKYFKSRVKKWFENA
jgi:predicted transcriptional regulator